MYTKSTRFHVCTTWENRRQKTSVIRWLEDGHQARRNLPLSKHTKNILKFNPFEVGWQNLDCLNFSSYYYFWALQSVPCWDFQRRTSPSLRYLPYYRRQFCIGAGCHAEATFRGIGVLASLHCQSTLPANSQWSRKVGNHSRYLGILYSISVFWNIPFIWWTPEMMQEGPLLCT